MLWVHVLTHIQKKTNEKIIHFPFSFDRFVDEFSAIYQIPFLLLFIWGLITICGAMLLVQMQIVECIFDISYYFHNFSLFIWFLYNWYWTNSKNMMQCCYLRWAFLYRMHSVLCLSFVKLAKNWAKRVKRSIMKLGHSIGICTHMNCNECCWRF